MYVCMYDHTAVRIAFVLTSDEVRRDIDNLRGRSIDQGNLEYLYNVSTEYIFRDQIPTD